MDFIIRGQNVKVERSENTHLNDEDFAESLDEVKRQAKINVDMPNFSRCGKSFSDEMTALYQRKIVGFNTPYGRLNITN